MKIVFVFVFFINTFYSSLDQLNFKRITNNVLEDLYSIYNFKEKDPEQEKQKQFIIDTFSNIFQTLYNNFENKNEVKKIILSDNEEDIKTITQIMKKNIFLHNNYEKPNKSTAEENIYYFNKNIVHGFLKDTFKYSVLQKNQNTILTNFSISQQDIMQSLDSFKRDIQNDNFKIQDNLWNSINIECIDENTKKIILPTIMALNNDVNLKKQFFSFLILHSSNDDIWKLREKEENKINTNIFDFINQSKNKEIFIQKAIISLLVNNKHISKKIKKNLIKIAFGYNSLIKNNQNNNYNKQNVSIYKLSTLLNKYNLSENDFNTFSTIQIFSDFEGFVHYYSKEHLKNKWYCRTMPSNKVSQIILQIESEFKDNGSEISIPDCVKKLFSLHNTCIQNKNKFLIDTTYFNDQKKGLVDILFQNSYLNLDYKNFKNNYPQFAKLKNNLKESTNNLNSYLMICLNEFNRSRSPIKDVIFKNIKDYKSGNNSILQKFQAYVFNQELKKYNIPNYDKNLFLKIPKPLIEYVTKDNNTQKKDIYYLENLQKDKDHVFISPRDWYFNTEETKNYDEWIKKIKKNSPELICFKIKDSFNKLNINEKTEYISFKNAENFIQLHLDNNPLSINEESIFNMIIENVNNSNQSKKSYNSTVLIGPSGTGKTFTAENVPYLEYWYRSHKGINNNRKNTYIAFSPNQIQGKYFSETEKNAQKLFDDIIKKIKNGESITLFIDECNPLFSKRSNGEGSDSVHNNVFDQVKNSFLAFMQDIASGKDNLYEQGGSLLIMAACNSTKDFEPALYGIGGRIKYVLEFLNLPHVVAPQYLEKIYSNTELFSYQDATFKNKLDGIFKQFFNYFKIIPHRGIDNVIEKVNTKINREFYGIEFTDIDKYNQFENLIINLRKYKKDIDILINNKNKNIKDKDKEKIFTFEETFLTIDNLYKTAEEIKKHNKENNNSKNNKFIINEKIKQFNNYFIQFRLKSSNDLIKLHILLTKEKKNKQNKNIAQIISLLEEYITTVKVTNEKILTQIKIEFETLKNEYFKEKNYNAKQEEMSFQNLIKTIHRDASNNLITGFKKSTDAGQRIQLLQNPLFYAGNWSDRIINRANIPAAIGVGGVVGYTKLFNQEPWAKVFNSIIDKFGMKKDLKYESNKKKNSEIDDLYYKDPTATDYAKILIPICVGIISSWVWHNLQNTNEDTKIIDKGYELKEKNKKPSQIYYTESFWTGKLDFNFDRLLEENTMQTIIDNAIHNAPAA